jgi:hypothetical protein
LPDDKKYSSNNPSERFIVYSTAICKNSRKFSFCLSGKIDKIILYFL